MQLKVEGLFNFNFNPEVSISNDDIIINNGIERNLVNPEYFIFRIDNFKNLPFPSLNSDVRIELWEKTDTNEY